MYLDVRDLTTNKIAHIGEAGAHFSPAKGIVLGPGPVSFSGARFLLQDGHWIFNAGFLGGAPLELKTGTKFTHGERQYQVVIASVSPGVGPKSAAGQKTNVAAPQAVTPASTPLPRPPTPVAPATPTAVLAPVPLQVVAPPPASASTATLAVTLAPAPVAAPTPIAPEPEPEPAREPEPESIAESKPESDPESTPESAAAPTPTPVELGVQPISKPPFLRAVGDHLRLILSLLPALLVKPTATTDAAIEGQPSAPATLLVTATASAVVATGATLVVVCLATIKGASPLQALLSGSIWAAVFLLGAVVWRPLLGRLLRAAHGTASMQASERAFMIVNLGGIVALVVMTLATVCSFWLSSPWLTLCAWLVATLWISGTMVRCLVRLGAARWLPATIIVLSSLALIGKAYATLSPGEVAALPSSEPASAPAPEPAAAATTEPAAVPEVARDAEADRYAEYLRKRDVIEKTVKANPVKLKRVEGALALYDRLQVELSKIEKQSKRLSKLHPKASAALLEQAETYERTTKLVDELYTKLVGDGR